MSLPRKYQSRVWGSLDSAGARPPTRGVFGDADADDVAKGCEHHPKILLLHQGTKLRALEPAMEGGLQEFEECLARVDNHLIDPKNIQGTFMGPFDSKDN